jgi:transcriptional regulator with XRE-family HTH domain
MQKIGYRLRKVRWNMNISIKDLARRCGLDRKTIQNIELNHHDDCYVSTIYKICRYTGISADYLLGFTKDKFYIKDSTKL